MSIDSGNIALSAAGGELDKTAARIAVEVRHASRSGQKTLTKVTSLVHAFRGPETSVGIDDVVAALRGQSLRIDSGWRDGEGLNIRRPGVLELSADNGDEALSASSGCDETIRVSHWSSDSVGYEEPLSLAVGPARPGVVTWFDVDPAISSRLTGSTADNNTAFIAPDGVREASEQRVKSVWQALGRSCPGLKEDMIRDLLRADLQPKVETYGNERDGVRSVSVFAVVARELPNDLDADGVSEALVFQLVEMLVGNGWLVTCWHSSRTFRGSSEEQPGPHMLRETFNSHVRYRWREAEPKPLDGKSSGDLGLYLARSLAATYGASYRMMERWVELWEVNFFKSLGGRPDRASLLREAAEEISNSLSMVAEFRRRISALEHARWSTTDKCWFPRLTDHGNSGVKEEDRSEQAKGLETYIQSEEKKLTRLSADIRADMDLLMLQSAATQQASSERLQSRLGLVTGLVLVPTLVVGMFGANTELPGRNNWLGFELMLAFMVISGVAVYLSIRKLTRDQVARSRSRSSGRGSQGSARTGVD